MEELQRLVKTTVDEIQKVICSSCIVGEPRAIGETTIMPLTKTGFWFAGGGGHDEMTEKKIKEGSKYGTGGAASVKPVAVVVIDAMGTRIESLSGVSGTIDSIAKKVPDVVSAMRKK